MFERAHRLLPAALALALACGDSDATTTDDATTAGSTDGTDATTSETTAPTDAGTGTDSSSDPSNATTDTTATDPTETSTDTDPTDTDTDTDPTGGAPLCTLEDSVCGLVERNTEVINCGELALEDPDADWQAAHDCVLEAVSQAKGFKLIHQQQGLDSNVGSGFAGQDGVGYALYSVFWDDWGVDAPPLGNAWARSCENIMHTPDCAPVSNSICLLCYPSGEETQICGE